MKLKNLLALLLALVLTLSCCAAFAEESTEADIAAGLTDALETEEEAASEETAGEEEESTTQFYDASLISAADLTAAEWMSSAETRALFAVLLNLEIATCDNAEAVALLDEAGIPTVYITDSATADLQTITVLFFLEDLEKVIFAMYVPLLDQFTVGINDISADPELVMVAMQSEGIFTDYESISFGDYYQALSDLNDAVNGED